MTILMVLAVLATDPIIAPGDQVTVKVLSQHLFPSPAFYSQPVAELALGQVLTVLESGTQWFRVSASSSLTGWVHSSAITPASAGSGSVGSGSGAVSQDEVTLAGRGFNSEIEAAYSSDNPGLDFDKVDAIEGFEVSTQLLEAFLAAGSLVEGPLVQETPAPSSGGSSR